MANQNLNFFDYLLLMFVLLLRHRDKFDLMIIIKNRITSSIASVGGAGTNNAGLITYVKYFKK